MNMQALDRASEAGSYAGAGAAFTLWGLSASEVAVLASAVFAGLSFAVHLWVSVRKDRREAERHRLAMQKGDPNGQDRREETS